MKMQTLLLTCASLVCSALVADAVPTNAPAGISTNSTTRTGLPKLVDFGANKCISCKKMAPILDALAKDFTGQLNVEFVDVWRKREAGKPFKIQLIPTQIFFDAAGKELFRHEGFYSRADILAKWKELGVTLTEPKKERNDGKAAR